MSLLLCAGWQLVFLGGNAPSFALVGGAAFLAASMQMPLPAVVLVMEFTQREHSYFVFRCCYVRQALISPAAFLMENINIEIVSTSVKSDKWAFAVVLTMPSILRTS